MSLHYKFGGSTASRTVACPAWHNLSANMGSQKAGLAAIEGTLMHLLFERGINDADFEPAEMLGMTREIEGTKLTVKPEHIEKVYTALDKQIDVEEKYLLDEVWPEVIMNSDDETGGTADIIAWVAALPKKPVEVFAVGDLKTGDGHMVYAENNEQLLFYAWQAVEKYKAKLKLTDKTIFALYIIQPSDRRDDPVDIWETDLQTIMAFAASYKRAQKEAKAGISTPCAGKHCAYCPAAPTCPAKTGLIASAKRIPKDSQEMAALVKALGMVDEVEDWCRAVRKTAHAQAEQGVKLEGFKLVAKRATRQWLDPAQALVTFKHARALVAEDYLEQKLKSPTQLEKLCKAKGIDFSKYADYYSLQSSGTTLVKDTDKRPEALALPALQDMAKRLKN